MTDSTDTAASRTGRRTFHLARRAEWEAQRSTGGYQPSTFAAEGFTHCTDGLDRLRTPANAYFSDDPGPFVVLEIDVDRVGAPVRYDADPPVYPHIYGPVGPAAVVATYAPERDDRGRFTGFRPEAPPGQRA